MGIIRPIVSSRFSSTRTSGGGARSVVKPTFSKKGSGKQSGGCKWCDMGECWTHGGKSRGGKGSRGKSDAFSDGGWVFIPASALGGKSMGKGKQGKQSVQWNRTMDKLNKIEAERKVWVGGLSQKVTWKELEKHFEESGGGKPKITEILSKGTGCCAFESLEDAQSAIAAVNGSELNGKTIEVDVWTEKEKKNDGDRPKRKFDSAFVKKDMGKGSEAKNVDPSLKVWVGGLNAKTGADALKKHFTSNGCKADVCSIMKKGTACVTFKTEDEVGNAVGVMNATELDGSAIEVDVWTKPERPDKKVKKEE